MNKTTLEQLYYQDKLSVEQIARALECSPNRVTYWMKKYGLHRRTISEAIYQMHNPDGDPFTVRPIRSRADAYLYGLGMGLYWGEGTKANTSSVRLGNTDPALLREFIRFLVHLYGVRPADLRFGLQIFTDTDAQAILQYWAKELAVNPSQFYKITVTISGSLGTYRNKKTKGVVTVYYNNKKLRDILVGNLPR